MYNQCFLIIGLETQNYDDIQNLLEVKTPSMSLKGYECCMVYNYVSIQLKQNIAQQNMVTNTIDDWITATYNRPFNKHETMYRFHIVLQ